MPPTTYVADRLLELLTAAEAGLTLARTGNPIPTRNLRVHGEPAVDVCDDNGLLVVYSASPAVRLTDPRANDARNKGPHHFVPVLRMVVELWRCVPAVDDDGVPTVTELDASAAALANDMWALVTYLGARLDGIFLTGLGAKVLAELGDPIPLGPRGQAAGWRLTVEIPVSDAGP